MSSATPPTFVVVGHVNDGKSSVVSTLALDDSVRISDAPGTTRELRRYPFRLGERTLYTLIDTPGFEHPRQMLDWLERHANSAADRRAAVEAFIEAHRDTRSFQQERMLLEPILAGGSILYVIDVSKPPSPAREAEMEILRWTGQPRLALMNQTAARDHGEPWRAVLGQYFNLVRRFDAHQADFHRRLELLRGLRELDEAKAVLLDEAVDALEADRAARRRTSAGLIAAALVEMCTHVEEESLALDVTSGELATRREALMQRFVEQVRRRERALHDALREEYLHRVMDVQSDPLEPVTGEDLFSRTTWSRLGLSRRQLAGAGAATGAAAGLGVDAATGGLSLGTGTLLGGLGGLIVGASGYLGFNRLARTRVWHQPMGGTLLRVGPMDAANFPWIVLDRALLAHRVIANHAHARHEAVKLPAASGGGSDGPFGGAGGVVAELPTAQRRALQQQFDRLRQRRGRLDPDAERDALAEVIEPILEQLDGAVPSSR